MALSLPFTCHSFSELAHVCPSTTRKIRLSLYKLSLSQKSRTNRFFRTEVRAIKEDTISREERVAPRINGVSNIELDGNGSAARITSGGCYDENESIENYLNSTAVSENDLGNGSLVKYANGNGLAVEVVEEVPEPKMEEVLKKKKKVEDIGQEEPWFKRGGRDQVEVDSSSM